MINDLIMVAKNTLSHEVSNGDVLRVISILSSEKKQVVLNKSSEYMKDRKIINLYYKKIIARHIDHDDDKYNIEIFVTENLLKKPEIYFDKDEIIAARVDWNNRVKRKKYSLEEKKLSYVNDEYINAIPIKFGYAITCHKAQGSEWEDVSIHLPIHHMKNETGLRWMYTAMTRSQKDLSFVNLPR
jgi:superfamily I DNA/RNA helicase